SDAEPMHPARMVAAARAACPSETVLAIDSGAHRAWCSQYWTSYGNGDYLSLANLGPMGGAIPLGIGAKLARPERPLVVATGDGACSCMGWRSTPRPATRCRSWSSCLITAATGTSGIGPRAWAPGPRH